MNSPQLIDPSALIKLMREFQYNLAKQRDLFVKQKHEPAAFFYAGGCEALDVLVDSIQEELAKEPNDA
jgi:hypothetical protein